MNHDLFINAVMSRCHKNVYIHAYAQLVNENQSLISLQNELVFLNEMDEWMIQRMSESIDSLIKSRYLLT